MIDIINDNFNDLAKDYYKLQEEYEQLQQENKQLKDALQELSRLREISDDILTELEEWLKEENKYSDYKDVFYRETMGYVLDKIQKLKEKYK